MTNFKTADQTALKIAPNTPSEISDQELDKVVGGAGKGTAKANDKIEELLDIGSQSTGTGAGR